MPDASQDHEHRAVHDHRPTTPTVTPPEAPTARKAEPQDHGAHEHHHGPGVPCTCGRDCLSCQEAALSVTCGCDFEAKQFEYASTAGSRTTPTTPRGTGWPRRTTTRR